MHLTPSHCLPAIHAVFLQEEEGCSRHVAAFFYFLLSSGSPPLLLMPKPFSHAWFRYTVEYRRRWFILLDRP